MTNFAGKNLNAACGGPQGGGMDSRRNTGVAEESPKYLAEVASNATPVGYKQTEVGVIPEDWSVACVSEVVKDHRLPSGIYKDKRLYGTGTKIIKLGDVFNFDIFSPKCAQRVQLPDSEMRAYNVEVDDIFIALASVKLEGVGKVMLVKELDEPTVYDHNVALIRVTAAIQSDYLAYLFKSEYVRKLVAQNATQVGTSFLKASTILGFALPLPVIKEQTAIANALSDVDALISELEKLIAKKQAIKTATMQQLLTGRTRLPQFALRDDGSVKGTKPSELGEIPEDWEVHTLDNVADVIDPHPSHRAPPEETNGIPFLGIGDFDESGSLLKSDTRIVSSDVYVEHRIRYKLEDGLLGLGRVASIGKVVKLRDDLGEYAVSPTLGVIKPVKIEKRYLFFFLKSDLVTEQFLKVMSGSTRSSVGMIVLRKLQIVTPPTDEAISVGKILSDMDEEIQALEQRLSKTRQIKQGIMQELLTGKTRLIKPSKEVIHE